MVEQSFPLSDRLLQRAQEAQQRAEVAEARLRLLEAHCAASEASAEEYDREHFEKTGYRSFSTPYLTCEMVRSVLGGRDGWT